MQDDIIANKATSSALSSNFVPQPKSTTLSGHLLLHPASRSCLALDRKSCSAVKPQLSVVSQTFVKPLMDHDNDQWQWLWLNRYQVTVQCGFGQHCRSSHLAVGSSAADCWTAPSVRQQGMSANMTASKIKQQNTAKHSKINFWQWRLWQVTPNPKSPCDPVASTGTGSAAHSDWRLPQWTQSREATSPKQWNRRALKKTLPVNV